MKDIVISGKRIQTELKVLLVVYVIANLLNGYAIWFYETNWVELWTFQRLILVITLLLYGLTWIARGAWFLIQLLRKKGEVA